MNEAWAEISVDGDRRLVYGPRLGRLYLLQADVARDSAFLWLTGLGAITRVEALIDPAARITHDRPALARSAGTAVSGRLRLVYACVRASRYVMTLRMAACTVRRAAPAVGRNVIAAAATASDIGRLVRAAEDGVKKGDCYARALLTAFLCLSAGRRCTLVVGVLAPTRKMHAWCSVDGEIPYEPFPEHFLYQPLWTLELAP